MGTSGLACAAREGQLGGGGGRPKTDEDDIAWGRVWSSRIHQAPPARPGARVGEPPLVDQRGSRFCRIAGKDGRVMESQRPDNDGQGSPSTVEAAKIIKFAVSGQHTRAARLGRPSKWSIRRSSARERRAAGAQEEGYLDQSHPEVCTRRGSRTRSTRERSGRRRRGGDGSRCAAARPAGQVPRQPRPAGTARQSGDGRRQRADEA